MTESRLAHLSFGAIVGLLFSALAAVPDVAVFSDPLGDAVIAAVPLPPEAVLSHDTAGPWLKSPESVTRVVLECAATSTSSARIELSVGFASLSGGQRRRRQAGVVAVSSTPWVRSIFAGLEATGLVSACGADPQSCATVVLGQGDLSMGGPNSRCALQWVGLRSVGGPVVAIGPPQAIDLTPTRVLYVDVGSNRASALLETQEQPASPTKLSRFRSTPLRSGDSPAPPHPRVSSPASPVLVKSGLVDPAGPCHAVALGLSVCVHASDSVGACRPEQRRYMRCQRRRLADAVGGAPTEDAEGDGAVEDGPDSDSDEAESPFASVGHGRSPTESEDAEGEVASESPFVPRQPSFVHGTGSATVGDGLSSAAYETQRGRDRGEAVSSSSEPRFSQGQTGASAAAGSRSREQVAADVAAELGVAAAEVAAMCAALGDADCPVRPLAAATLPMTGAGAFVPGGVGPFGFDISSMAGESSGDGVLRSCSL